MSRRWCKKAGRRRRCCITTWRTTKASGCRRNPLNLGKTRQIPWSAFNDQWATSAGTPLLFGNSRREDIKDTQHQPPTSQHISRRSTAQSFQASEQSLLFHIVPHSLGFSFPLILHPLYYLPGTRSSQTRPGVSSPSVHVERLDFSCFSPV